MTTCDRWRRLEELFQAVSSLDPAARQDRLTAESKGDADLVGEVEALLRAAVRSGDGGFITEAIAGTASEIAEAGRAALRMDPRRPAQEPARPGGCE